jgi:excisionase family DNA binding protein
VASATQAASASLQFQTIFQNLDNVTGLLTAAQVCGFLCCHPKTLYEWTRQGRIAAFRMGRTFRYDPADVYVFLGRRRSGVKRGTRGKRQN